MNKRWIALLGLLAATVTTTASAQAAGDWMVRARAVHLDSANKDSTDNDLNVNNKGIPEVDISYFFSPNLAAELILTIPQKHTLYSGTTKIGSLKHLPPTLTAQYHFAPGATVRPYVGAGVNLTLFSSVQFDANVAALDLSIKKSSVGLALQAGVDYAIDKNWTVNLDVKKVQIKTEVKAGATSLGDFKVDPLLVGLGVGYKF
jgi:outer membrane protein